MKQATATPGAIQQHRREIPPHSPRSSIARLPRPRRALPDRRAAEPSLVDALPTARRTACGCALPSCRRPPSPRGPRSVGAWCSWGSPSCRNLPAFGARPIPTVSLSPSGARARSLPETRLSTSSRPAARRFHAAARGAPERAVVTPQPRARVSPGFRPGALWAVLQGGLSFRMVLACRARAATPFSPPFVPRCLRAVTPAQQTDRED